MTAPVAITERPVPILERLSSKLVPELRKYLTLHRGSLADLVAQGGSDAGTRAAKRHSKAIDGLLSSLFAAAQVAMQCEGRWIPVSLACVGSYGREELSPHSDLDVRLLTDHDIDRAIPVAEALLYPLWDAGLSIGHQVVNLDEYLDLARRDLPTATSLLDWRTVAGDREPGQRMLDRAYGGLFGPGEIGDFLKRLAESAEDRHERFGGSVYLLEPDVKNGQGGLRDLDVARWAACARWRVADFGDLVRIGMLVPREWAEIEAARNFLFRVRNLLHVHAGRRADRMSFEIQERLAVDLGYGKGGPGVERFMSEYYRQARTLSKTRESLVARAMPPPKRRVAEESLGRGLKLRARMVSIEDPDSLADDPAIALRLYDEAVRRDTTVYPFARDAVSRACSAPEFCEALRASEEAAEIFVRLCTTAQETKLRKRSIIAELHDVGLLLAMIPEFSPVVGRVHHDIYHVYTVDVHSVAAVDRLRALCRGDLAAEHPLACRLAAEIGRARVLYFATLLHDIGKDMGGKNHADRGSELAETILGRLRFRPEEIAEVQHLIQKHLRMYHVATRRDIDDPTTIEEFANDIHGLEGLRELYLLTVSDVSTTSPTAMTSWKARMLDELEVATERWFVEGRSVRDETGAQRIRARVLEIAAKDDGFLAHFLRAVPERYLYANEPEEIVQHARVARESEGSSGNFAALGTSEPYVEIAVVADDKPGLLQMITACLAASKVKVLDAQIYCWTDRNGRARALDMFWVRRGEESELVRQCLPRLQRDFETLLESRADPFELVTGRSAPSWSIRSTPPVASKVSIDNRSASRHTVIEVITRDRRALLFWLATTLQRCQLSIDVAKINTEGERVADVFYVTDSSGNKITDPGRLQEIQARVLSTLADLEKERT